jgi:hypothetical protein
VSSGLAAGDRVIVAGIQGATPGAKVAAIEEQKADAKPKAAAMAVSPAAAPHRVAAVDTAR